MTPLNKPCLNKTSRLLPSVIWLVFIFASLAYLVMKINIVSDIKQFMPNNSNDKRLQVLLHESKNSLATSLILVQLEGGSSDYLAQTNKYIKRLLQNDKTLFSSVLNGEKNTSYEDIKKIMSHRYLLRDAGDFSVTELRSAFEYILNTYRSGSNDDLIDYLLADPQQTLIHYFEQLSTQQHINRKQGVWFNAAYDKTYLMLQMNSKGLDLDSLEQGIARINEALLEADSTQGIALTLSGPGIFAVATRDSIRDTTKLMSVALTLFVLFLFWYSYNAFSLAFLGLLPLLSAIIAAMAATQFFFTELHGIVLAFGITLLGVCLDYPLHLFSHANKKSPLSQTLERIWPTLRLGALSSIFAYLALMGTGFDGLNQLAIFAAVGLVTALLVTRYIIPAWLSSISYSKRIIPTASPYSSRRKLLVSALIFISCFFIISQVDTIWSRDVSDINPVSKELRLLDKEIRLALHASDVDHLFLLSDTTIEQVLIKTENIKGHLTKALDKGIFSSVLVASDILPSQKKQIALQAKLPDQNTLEKNVNSALNGLVFNKSAFSGFIQDVTNAAQQEPIHYQQFEGSRLALPLKSLLFKQNDQWYSLVRISGVVDEESFKQWLVSSPSFMTESYLSLHDASSTLMSNYLDTASLRLWIVIIIISVITIALSFKRRNVLWGLVPVLLSVLISITSQVLLGHLITIFHVLSLLLVIGMGIDYSLFFNRNIGKDEQNKKSELGDTTHAISISALTTVASFGLLGLSDVPILAAMGQTVAIGILSCFILAQRIAVPYQQFKELNNQ